MKIKNFVSMADRFHIKILRGLKYLLGVNIVSFPRGALSLVVPKESDSELHQGL
jgi:hypothetical protein